MPLVPVEMVRGVRSALKIPGDASPASRQVSRKPGEWARAYESYASKAVAGPGIPSFTGSEARKFEGLLSSAFRSPGPPAAFASSLANAIEAFWLAPPVAFVVAGGSGIASAFPGKAQLVATLIENLSSPQPSAVAAQRIGIAVDSATRTIIVLITIPPAGPVPTPLM